MLFSLMRASYFFILLCVTMTQSACASISTTSAETRPPRGLTVWRGERHEPRWVLVGESSPLALGGDVGINVRAALDARNGALRNVTVRPGETWSFNETVGHPDKVTIVDVNGVPGGGWCDLSSRYVEAARSVLPDSALQFQRHVPPLRNVRPEDSVSIWNIDGTRGSAGGRMDLLIHNASATTIRFIVVEERQAIKVQAWREQSSALPLRAH